jgi:hypothetical protein
MTNSRKVEVTWSDPPERTRRDDYDVALKQVKEAPGRWARIRTTPTSGGAYNSRKTVNVRTAGDEHWETRVGQLEEPTADGDRFGLWVRYRTEEQIEEGIGLP